MDKSGWIAIHRKLRNHWIWKDPEKLKAWLDILLEVNHKGKKVNFGDDLLQCNRGQSLHSVETWARRWKWSRSRAYRFLKLLESDSMIELKSERITTRLTVLNYDSYQDVRNADETQMKRKRNANETTADTNNNDNNDNNEETEAATGIFVLTSLETRYEIPTRNYDTWVRMFPQIDVRAVLEKFASYEAELPAHKRAEPDYVCRRARRWLDNAKPVQQSTMKEL